MGIVDTTILFAYLALILGLGFYAQHRKQGVEDYFVAGRRLGPVTIACLWVAAWIGGASIVGTSARVYELGVTGIWYILAIAIGCLLFGLTMARRVKRLGDRHQHLTYPDFIEQHYDNRTRLVATVTTVLAYTAYTAGQFAAAAAMLQVLLGWDYGYALLLSGAIVILYTAIGGYLAVTYTDRLQVALVLLGIVAIGVPVAISQAGSWADMRSALPASYYDLGAQGWDRVAALVVSLVLSFFVAMDSFSRSFAARDAAAARNGALLAMVVILPIALAVAWLGLASAVLYPDRDVSAGILTTFVLEAFPVGLKGLMVIGILSAIMSVASICVLTASANYARDIHQRYFKPDIAPAAMLKVGTLASLGAGVLAMLMAWKMRDIIDILQLGFTINSAALFLPTIAAIYWDRVLCRRRVLEQQHVPRDGDRLAHRRRRRGGRRVQHRSAVAWPARLVRGARRDARGGAQAGRGSRRVSGGPVIVFAEMPEAAGRDLSIERQQLPPSACIETFTYRGDKEALIDACRDADAILTDYVPFDDSVLQHLHRCRIISVAATGWDCVDVAAAAARGIGVSCVGEYCTQEVADHTLALLLALNRRLLAYHEQVQTHRDWRWNEVRDVQRLAGRTMGLIGFGRIGQAVCRRARAFGLEVLASDPRIDEQTARRHEARLCDVDELLAASHIVSLHCNLHAGNLGLLNRDAFARMRLKPLLINVARGGLIVEADLVRALDDGQVSGAALDVLAQDSPDLGAPSTGRSRRRAPDAARGLLLGGLTG